MTTNCVQQTRNSQVILAVISRRRRRRSEIAGAGLSLYARLISHFNITNIVI